MDRFKSKQTAYDPLKKKYVPLWNLDTNTVTVTQFKGDTLTEESKTYHTDFIRYHLHFSDSHCPDRLSRLVNEGKIMHYLDDMELKVSEAITRQVELWKRTDSCYQRRCSVWRTALSVWQEKRYLSVWFIFEFGRLCLRVQPFFSTNY